MNIASRYLFARKISLVNVISFISVFGVAGMTAALIVILSVFNGFSSLICSMMNEFDPDLKATPAQGKTFMVDSAMYQRLLDVPGVGHVSLCVEETALFQYDTYQYIASIKGVDDNFADICDIESSVYVGEYMLYDESGVPYAILGAEVASNLWIMVNSSRPLSIYAPLRHERIAMNPDEAFSRALVVPGGVFHIHQDFDSKYVIVPIGFVRRLLEYDNDEVSSVEISVSPGADVSDVQKRIQDLFGGACIVKDRMQQQEVFYKIMRSEKMAIVLMLCFIIVIASFNIIGALTMLILDKQRDIQILRHLGATESFVRSIFLRTGQLITITGVLLGMVLGLLVCWAQIKFQLIKFPEGGFIIDAYPVEVETMDVVLSCLVVAAIGFVASIIPSRKVSAD